jgi:hypothetical protein
MIVVPVAESLNVPTDSLYLTGAAWPIQPIGTNLLLGLLGVGLVLLASRIPLRRRRAATRSYVLAGSTP